MLSSGKCLYTRVYLSVSALICGFKIAPQRLCTSQAALSCSYDVYLAWFNEYFAPSGTSAIKPLRTGFGFPSQPQSPQAFALSPDTVLLYWTLPQTLNAPAGEIKYKVREASARAYAYACSEDSKPHTHTRARL